MNRQRSIWTVSLVASVWLSAGRYLTAEVLEKSMNVAGTTVQYKVVLPNNYDPGKAYAGVLAFGGGTQMMRVVESAIDRNWREEAERQGYIVVIPAAPNGELLFEEGERIFPEFLDKFLRDYKIQNNKFHIAGNSNGGLSAFHVAASHPGYFLSVTGFPGYLYDPTAARVRAISKMCINMHVGELDPDWLSEMEFQAKAFRANGLTVRFTVEKGQPHRIDTLAGAGAKRLFDQFEEARQGCAK